MSQIIDTDSESLNKVLVTVPTSLTLFHLWAFIKRKEKRMNYNSDIRASKESLVLGKFINFDGNFPHLQVDAIKEFMNWPAHLMLVQMKSALTSWKAVRIGLFDARVEPKYCDPHDNNEYFVRWWENGMVVCSCGTLSRTGVPCMHIFNCYAEIGFNICLTLITAPRWLKDPDTTNWNIRIFVRS